MKKIKYWILYGIVKCVSFTIKYLTKFKFYLEMKRWDCVDKEEWLRKVNEMFDSERDLK